jgi:hypothetical protein
MNIEVLPTIQEERRKFKTDLARWFKQRISYENAIAITVRHSLYLAPEVEEHTRALDIQLYKAPTIAKQIGVEHTTDVILRTLKRRLGKVQEEISHIRWEG